MQDSSPQPLPGKRDGRIGVGRGAVGGAGSATTLGSAVNGWPPTITCSLAQARIGADHLDQFLHCMQVIAHHTDRLSASALRSTTDCTTAACGVFAPQK